MPDKENKIENKDTASSEEKPQNKVEDESSQKPSKKEAPENLSDVKAKDEKLEESEGPDTKEETSSEISDIKLSGLMGTKIGMTQTIMEDSQGWVEIAHPFPSSFTVPSNGSVYVRFEVETDIMPSYPWLSRIVVVLTHLPQPQTAFMYVQN